MPFLEATVAEYQRAVFVCRINVLGGVVDGMCQQIDVGGYGIIWGDELDLSCDELWEHGERVNTPFDGLMSFGDASELWGLSESTLRKAVSYGKLVNGVDVCKFGKQWVVSKAAMKRAYGETKR